MTLGSLAILDLFPYQKTKEDKLYKCYSKRLSGDGDGKNYRITRGIFSDMPLPISP
jgi:hypothetical protein